MKRWLVFGMVALALMALLVPAALAQGPTPPVTGQDCPMWGQGGRGGMMDRDDMMGRGGAAMMGGWAGLPDEALALLGLSAEEVQAQHQAGKSLADIAAAQGVALDKLVDSILAARVDALDALVKDGKITQAQADLMASRMKEMVTQMVERDQAGPMWNDGEDSDSRPMWNDGNRGGMRGGRQFSAPQAPTRQPGGLKYQSF